MRGNISPENICDLWAVKKDNKAKGAEFYNAEFDRARKTAPEGPIRL